MPPPRETSTAQDTQRPLTWVAIKELCSSQMAPNNHRTDAGFQQLCSAKQGQDQIVTLFGAYIVATCESTNIADYNKRIFF
jgi:hypothetical protein